MATYDPMQSLAVNLANAGYAPQLDSPGGTAALNPTFLAAIQTAFAQDRLAQGQSNDYGGQTTFDLIAQADPARANTDPLGYANELLAKSGVSGFSGVSDLQSRYRMLPGNEPGNSFGDFVGGSIEHLGDTASDLWSEPGFRALALTAAGGSMLGGPAGTTGTAGSLMPAAVPESAASLANMGLTQTAPGVWSAAAPVGAGALGGATAAAPGTLMPPAVPEAGAVAGTGLAAAPAVSGLSSLLSSPTALGMGAGALLGGLGGSQQAGTVTTEEGLPDWLKAYAKPALDKYSTDLQNYQIDPYGVMPSAMREFQNTISGMYLDPSTNKYLEDYFKLGAERIKGSLSPSFGHMQAFGQHSGYNESLSRGLGDFATGLYGGNYAKERDRQTQLTASAPAFIGQSSQAAFQPYQQYLGTVGSLGKKKDEPYFENPFGNILGGALAGGSLGRIWG
jgi:hypothetical protein